MGKKNKIKEKIESYLSFFTDRRTIRHHNVQISLGFFLETTNTSTQKLNMSILKEHMHIVGHIIGLIHLSPTFSFEQ